MVFLLGSVALDGIHAITNAGIPIVMAAANDDHNVTNEWAGSIDEPIVVGAALPPYITDPDFPGQPGTAKWQRAVYSNFGQRVDCWASSVVWTNKFDDKTTRPKFELDHFDGTSAAAPQVCAVIALMIAAADKAGYRLSIAQIRDILRSSGHVEAEVNQEQVFTPSTGALSRRFIPAAILNAEDAVRKVIERAPNPAMRDVSKYAAREFQGVMTNISPSGPVETADLIFGDATTPVQGGLGPVARGAYGEQTRTNTWFTSSGNYTLISGEGWPQSGPGSPMTPPFDVYSVNSAAIEPTVRQVSPGFVPAGQQTTIKVDGHFLVPKKDAAAVKLGVFELDSDNQPVPIREIDANPGGTFTHAEFNWDGSLPPKNYHLGIEALGGATITDGLGSQIIISVQAPVPVSSSKYVAKLFNIDDNGHVSVNINSNVLNVGYGQTGEVDLSPYINVAASNTVQFTLFNVGGPIAWGFEIHKVVSSGNTVISDTLIYRNVAGTFGGYGAHNNDPSSGRIFDQYVVLSEDSTFRYYGANNDPPVCNSYNLGALTGPTLCP